MRSIIVVGTILLLVGTGCGSSESGSTNPGTGGSGAAAGSTAAGGSGGTGATGGSAGSAGTGDWQTLIQGDWSLAPGSEEYYCVRKTLDQDAYVQAFSAENPLGTHHTVLTIGPPDGPDGITKCDSNMQKSVMIFASGVGTNPVSFPNGVAVKLQAGQQLLLNLHLFNTSTQTLSGTSGTQMQIVPVASVQQEAQALLMGPMNFDLPPKQQTTITGDCTQNADVTLFAMMPHMHQLGIHMKVTANSSMDGTVVVHDGDYSFDDQAIRDIGPVKMATGDKVHIECTYNNVTNSDVTYGPSTLDEMCFAAMYRYPMAPTGQIVCIH